MSKWDITVNSKVGLESTLEDIRKMFEQDKYLDIVIRTGKTRSGQQRKAIEVYCRELAKALNDAGYDQKAIFNAMKQGVEIPNSQESVKGHFKFIQKAMFGNEKTSEADRDWVSKVYETFNRWTGEKFGVSMEFPHIQKED